MEQKKKPKMAKGKTITPGQLWRARQKQQDAQRFNGMKGKRGFLVCANRGREPNANLEAVAWLDGILGDQQESDSEDEEEEDIQKLVERELNAEQAKQKKRRFFDLGLDCLTLVRAPSSVDPLTAVRELFESVLSTGEAKWTHMEKIVPFQIICHSAPEVIVQAVRTEFARCYQQQSTFAIQVKIRGVASGGPLDRSGLIKLVADMVTSEAGLGGIKVDLENPEIIIIIEVIRSITGIVVLAGEEFRRFKKFNLRALTSNDDEE